MPVAFITGITGQDGSYLCELLLGKGYEVHGTVRRSSSIARTRIDHLTEDPSIYGRTLYLHYADLNDSTAIRRLIQRTRPDELYHLAGQSHVGASFEIPESTSQFAAMGTLGILEVLRDCDKVPRLLHASSSEVFGRPEVAPQTENTAFRPVTPYGVAKTFATNMVRVYRESFGVFACNAICFNHESPRRGESFVTRKITRAAAQIKLGQASEVLLGNLDGQRDWGYAPDFVNAFHLALQAQEAGDFVLGSGVQRTVRDWLEVAFGHVDLQWQDFVRQDSRYMRQAEPSHLVADPITAKKRFGWHAETEFEEMVCSMVDADLDALGP
ncbi:MAG: GDP-mannose 4,6-dehydratase [Aureliella sp.]